MIDRTIAWSVANRWLVIAASLALAAGGAWAMRHTPLDAIPDLSDVQVIISTEWPGRSPDLIEDQITYPDRDRARLDAPECGRSAASPISASRTSTSSSRTAPTSTGRAAACSSICRAFADHAAGGRDAGDRTRRDRRRLGVRVRARRRERRAHPRRAAQPAGLEAALRPGSRSRRRGSGQHRRLRQAVPGQPRPEPPGGLRPVDQGRSSRRFAPATTTSKAGCSSSPAASTWCAARGYLTSLADIEQISLGADAKGHAGPRRRRRGRPPRARHPPRRGRARRTRRGRRRHRHHALRRERAARDRRCQGQAARGPADASSRRDDRPHLRSVDAHPRVDRHAAPNPHRRDGRRLAGHHRFPVSLPVGAHSDPRAADRGRSRRSSRSATSASSANIMSLGGIALAIGVLVDASIVMVENAYRHVAEEAHAGGPSTTSSSRSSTRHARSAARSSSRSRSSSSRSCRCSCSRRRKDGCSVRWPSPRRPPSRVATLLAITLVPVLMAMLLVGSGRSTPRRANPVARFCAGRVRAGPAAGAPLEVGVPGRQRRRRAADGAAAVHVGPASSCRRSTKARCSTCRRRRRASRSPRRRGFFSCRIAVLRAFPEVERVFGTAGRATTATDNSPMGMVNTTVTLKPRDQWRPGMTFERLAGGDGSGRCSFPASRTSGRSRFAAASTCSSPESRRRSASRFSGPILPSSRISASASSRSCAPCRAPAASTPNGWRRATSPTSGSIAQPSRDTGCRSGREDVVQSAIGGSNIASHVRRPRALSGQRAVPARLPRRPSGARARAGQDAGGSPGAAGPAGGDHAHDRTGDDPRRERTAGRVRLRRYGDAATSAAMWPGRARPSTGSCSFRRATRCSWSGQYEFQVRAREPPPISSCRSSCSSIFMLLYHDLSLGARRR